MVRPEPVRSADDALHNIENFERELAKHTGLQDRLSQVHAWYAARRPDGSWTFGPSKFVGYRNNDGKRYLLAEAGAHGGKTERVLESWFGEVDPRTPLGKELSEALREFLRRWHRAPRKSLRIKVQKSELDNVPDAAGKADPRAAEALLSRISVDPRICGGRPCISGTRMRVSDVVEMVAHGATRAEILDDYPYLADEDIAAALAYAARATDHRVIRAA